MPRLPPRGSAPRRLPLDPPAIPGARVALPSDSLGLYKEPPTAVESAHNARPSQGDGCGPSPCDPLGRRLRRCGPCRGSRVHRRRPARGAAARQGGDPVEAAPSPRGHPVKGPHGTPHKPPRGARAWWRLPCRPLTGRARPRRLSPEQKRRAAGSQGHTQGAVPTPCGKEEPDGLLRIRYR